ncbi:MAG: hypothetical protein ACM3U2_15350 [Deltaproteobacteria bacterium]
MPYQSFAKSVRSKSACAALLYSNRVAATRILVCSACHDSEQAGPAMTVHASICAHVVMIIVEIRTREVFFCAIPAVLTNGRFWFSGFPPATSAVRDPGNQIPARFVQLQRYGYAKEQIEEEAEEFNRVCGCG